MNLKELHIHIFVLASATAGEFALLTKLPSEYYIESEIIPLWNEIHTCRFSYSPSLAFVLLVLLPSIVLLALHSYLRKPALKKLGLAIGVPVLLVVLVSLINPSDALWILPITSVGVGAVLGEGKGEKALLVIEGLLPGFVVLMMILGRISGAC